MMSHNTDKKKNRSLWKITLVAAMMIVGFLTAISQAKAYENQKEKYQVILANSGKTKEKYIYLDLTGSVSISQNPSVRYFCTEDINTKTYNTIAPPAGTKILYREMEGDREYKWWYSKGGSASGTWSNNKKNKITLKGVDATATTPHIRLPKVSKPGYTFTGWQVTETQSCWNYYNGAYRNWSGSNGGVKLGSDGYYYINIGAYSTIKTVKPTWRANNFYVRFHANGGSGYMADQTFTYGVSQNLRTNTFTRTGYTFSGWKVQREYDNKWAWAEGHGNGEYWQSGEPWGSDIRIYTDGGSIAKTTYSGYVNMYAQWTPNNYYLDVNGLLDGTATGNTAGYGTFDVYINGNLVANDVTDFYQQYAYGAKYEIKDIKSNTGKTYNGVSSGSISGTIGTSNSIQLKFTTTQYSNSISHWMFGFTKGEGNNSGKNAWLIGNTSFTSTYNSSYKMDSSRAKRIPNGFQLASTFGTSSISGSWQSYPLGTTVTQKAGGMSYEYDYAPITYQINYDMQGGTNSSTNPTTYNVLYGVTLQNPTRRGFTFDGWLLNGQKVTGINPGANAVFTSESDMYNKLASRTTGNVTLTAKWINHTPEFKPEIDGTNPDNNPIPPFFKEDNVLVIQKNDKFTPENYITVNDKEDGNSIEDKLTIENHVPINDKNEAYQSGEYDVIYKATDEGGATGSYTLTVIVNEPPVIDATDRTFFKGQTGVDSEELLRKVTATDSEDGSLTDRIEIVQIDYQDGRIDKNVTKLDTSKTGSFTITYTVTDNYKKTVTKTATIKVIDNQSVVNAGKTGSIRFINQKYLNTIKEQSIWKTNDEYNSVLKDSLNSGNETAQKYSSTKIQSMRGE
ncbi:MAG: InlB B-repeat-containing protein [Massilimicrobiota timonensis]